ncbi:MAG: 2Fe-2S iron-sulfur cluster-binding protein [Candidatus Kapabacteria bacterium]|nr:2Fe-2S iron-sulfur cluster-binding protein [Candidatus Kapabacteria bacterium]MDW8012723.1 2Fe-2S iron-sulfur cluster-binding protein [Bacteroidota bacterium]
MPVIAIDGHRVEAPAGKTIIEAAYESGLQIPHFCWHPALSVAGNCRMCLVEVGLPKRRSDGTIEVDEKGQPVIEFLPKLQIACATPIADGMVVRTKSERAVRAQEAVMEFLLINHPLDCPICDEAGQCKLQEYAFRHSRGVSRFTEEKVHKPKRVIWGPTIIFDAERCILCSRCIRFANEIAKQPVLTFVERNDHVTIELYPGTEFDNPYSMNVIELCPVGALTSRDFRFRARVWEMSFTDSICPGCARGCNIRIGVRNNEILRLEPRRNLRVNQYWMCDEGRLTQYGFVNHNRVDGAWLRRVSTEKPESVSWEEAYEAVASVLRRYKPSEIAIIGSGRLTNEDAYALVKFARTVLKTPNMDFPRREDPYFEDDFLRCRDRNPNTTGVVEIGLKPGAGGVNLVELPQKVRYGAVRVLYVVEEDVASISPELRQALEEAEIVIVHATNHNETTKRSHIVLATTTYAELEGTYTNIQRYVQLLRPAVATKERERYTGMQMSRWDKFGAWNDRWTHGPRRNCRQTWQHLKEIARLLGTLWKWHRSEDVFRELAQEVPSFSGMTYELLEAYQGVALGRGLAPEPVPAMRYESHVLKP